MRKTVIVFLLMSIVLLSGCAGSESTITSESGSSESVSGSVQQSSSYLSESELSLSEYYDDVSFPSDFKKYESYVRDRSDWTYVDTDHLVKYAKLPAPSCIYSCSYGYGDKGVLRILWVITIVLLHIFALLNLRDLNMMKQARHPK